MSSTDSATTAAGFTAVQDGKVLRVTITKPKRKNAVDYDTVVALGDTFLAAADNRAIRVIVLTGEGVDFCTGADLAATPVEAARGITPEMSMDAANRLVKAIVAAPVPVIARIRGAAAGLAVGMALAADLTYASEEAYLLLAFVNIGLMSDGGATAMVAAAAGRPLAAEMALLGERLPAPAAARAGLITAAVPEADLDARVEAAVEKIVNGPRRAMELTKKTLNQAALGALEPALAAEKTGQMELLQAPDFLEGATAMLTKRKPVFAD